MQKLSFFLATSLLILPATAWSRQTAAEGQQAAATAPSKSQEQVKKTDSKPADATQSSVSTEASQDPLAAAARRAKEQRKTGPKPAKVFTNDDIPSSGGISTIGEKPAASDGTAPADKAAANDEKTWRDKFDTLRHKLAQDQAALDVMQRELGELNVQYYSDPVKAMQQQYTRSDINNKTAAIDAKKKEIDADQQAISTAEDDLRKAGGDPGWAR